MDLSSFDEAIVYLISMKGGPGWSKAGQVARSQT